MNKYGWHALACGAAMGLAAAMPASAGTVTFEDVVPNLFATGDTFTSGDFSFATDGFFGAVDTSGGFFYAAPAGSVGQFYSGLNDSSVRMTATSGGYVQLSGFDFAYVGDAFSAGRLVAQGDDGNGNIYVESWAFNPLGFISVGAGDLGAFSSRMASVTFSACINIAGVCTSNPNLTQNLAQFAIDNIRADVPEPASLALVLAALGVAGATTRRRQST